MMKNYWKVKSLSINTSYQVSSNQSDHMPSLYSENILEQLEKNFMINLNIIDIHVLIHKIIDDYMQRAKKELTAQEMELLLPTSEGFASRIINLTETNLKKESFTKEELEKRLLIISQLFDESSPAKFKNDKL